MNQLSVTKRVQTYSNLTLYYKKKLHDITLEINFIHNFYITKKCYKFEYIIDIPVERAPSNSIRLALSWENTRSRLTDWTKVMYIILKKNYETKEICHEILYQKQNIFTKIVSWYKVKHESIYNLAKTWLKSILLLLICLEFLANNLM